MEILLPLGGVYAAISSIIKKERQEWTFHTFWSSNLPYKVGVLI